MMDSIASGGLAPLREHFGFSLVFFRIVSKANLGVVMMLFSLFYVLQDLFVFLTFDFV